VNTVYSVGVFQRFVAVVGKAVEVVERGVHVAFPQFVWQVVDELHTVAIRVLQKQAVGPWLPCCRSEFATKTGCETTGFVAKSGERRVGERPVDYWVAAMNRSSSRGMLLPMG
jgi:hypothetical protein